MGMQREKAMTFAAGSYVGNRRAYSVTSAKIKEARAGRDFGFTPDERTESMGEDEQR
jgi:hypothetical protein